MPPRHHIAVLTGAALALTVTACGQPADPGKASSTSVDAIAVAAGDTTCDVARASAAAGALEFTVHNEGSKVTDFYLYGDGDHVIGEAERIAPGRTRTLHVQVADPGTYQTACKPGMRGTGIRGDFTVTGATSTAAPDVKMDVAVTQYQGFVATQADALLERTTSFVAAVKAGDVARAKAEYPLARGPWERIEPVAESFGDLDPRIDGREDVIAEGQKFTGFHRLEKDLWAGGLKADSSAVADQLLADVTQIVGKAKQVRLNPLQLANGAKGLLDEVATGKISGEEDRYSHTDLFDFDENVKGAKAAIDALRPVLQERNPALLTQVDSKFTALEGELDRYRTDTGFRLYTELTPAQVKGLSVAVDAVSEPLSKVAGVVAAQ